MQSLNEVTRFATKFFAENDTIDPAAYGCDDESAGTQEPLTLESLKWWLLVQLIDGTHSIGELMRLTRKCVDGGITFPFTSSTPREAFFDPSMADDGDPIKLFAMIVAGCTIQNMLKLPGVLTIQQQRKEREAAQI